MPDPSPQDAGAAGVDPKAVAKQARIAEEDAEARQEEDVVVRKAKSGEGGTSFAYGEVSPLSDYAGKETSKKVDLARRIAEDDAAEKREISGALLREPIEGEGGVSFEYGPQK